MLSTVQALALRTPDKVVNERTNEMDEDDNLNINIGRRPWSCLPVRSICFFPDCILEVANPWTECPFCPWIRQCIEEVSNTGLVRGSRAGTSPAPTIYGLAKPHRI